MKYGKRGVNMEMLEMYQKVFEDMVKCRLEDLEAYEGIKLSKEQIKRIAYKLIYDSDYLWEQINDTIDIYIRKDGGGGDL